MPNEQERARRREYMRAYRANQSDSVTRIRRIADAINVAETRARESPEVTRRRRQSSQVRMRVLRANSDVTRVTHDNYRDADVSIHYIGEMNKQCNKCNAYLFPGETSNSCCHNGKVQPQRFVGYPDFLKDLFTNRENPNFVNFKKHIINYNASLSFASIGMRHDESLRGTRGVQAIKCHGMTYHLMAHLHPEQTQDRAYAQIFVYAPEEAAERRLEHPANSDLERALLVQIHDFLAQNNPYAIQFKAFNDALNESGAESMNMSLIFKRNVRRINRNDPHPGRYNAPVASEIAFIYQSDPDGLPQIQRDFVVYPRTPAGQASTFRIHYLSKHLNPMCYVLFYPNGEEGWSPIPGQRINLDELNEPARDRNVTQLQFYSSQLFKRPNIYNPILDGGRLFHVWVIDKFLNVETNRLDWHRKNQAQLRVDQYRGLMDALESEANEVEGRLGRVVILASSFEGSARNMNEHYHDAMAIVAKYGFPELFITMTANTEWPEIIENLHQNQTAFERPDLIDRVFKKKT